MDILFLLVPVSVLLALGVVGLLAWSVWSGITRLRAPAPVSLKPSVRMAVWDSSTMGRA
jgi:hypothetical protein